MKRMSPIKGAAVMTVFSLMCKLIGTLQRLYTASRIGSEGMGLFFADNERVHAFYRSIQQLDNACGQSAHGKALCKG